MIGRLYNIVTLITNVLDFPIITQPYNLMGN